MNIIGIDVSKGKLDVLCLGELPNRAVKTKIFNNNKAAYPNILKWALKNCNAGLGEIQFVMEATGIYHEALAYALFELGANVFVVNPARIKAHGKGLGIQNKTDKKDSYVIAHYGATMEPEPWQPEPANIRELKELIARFQAIEKDLQRELNRQEKAIIRVSSEMILSSINTMVDVLKKQKHTLQTMIDQHIEDNPSLRKDRHLLESIPGVGSIVSVLMLATIGSRKFKQATQCSAFLGLNPVQFDSGSSIHRPSRISKRGDGRIRAKLYMAAIVAIKYNPDIKQQYKRLLKNGKSKMAALGAAMRKLVQICFGVLKHQNRYQPQTT